MLEKLGFSFLSPLMFGARYFFFWVAGGGEMGQALSCAWQGVWQRP